LKNKTMEQKKLFKVPEFKKPKSNTTCRTCEFKYKHEYGKMFYCSKQKQKETSYGHRKIKAGNPACHMYEKIID